MRDLESIGLTEEIRGEAIMPREVDVPGDPEPVTCPRCEGTGHVGGTSHGRYLPDTCPTCGGDGAVEEEP